MSTKNAPAMMSKLDTKPRLVGNAPQHIKSIQLYTRMVHCLLVTSPGYRTALLHCCAAICYSAEIGSHCRANLYLQEPDHTFKPIIIPGSLAMGCHPRSNACPICVLVSPAGGSWTAFVCTRAAAPSSSHPGPCRLYACACWGCNLQTPES